MLHRGKQLELSLQTEIHFSTVVDFGSCWIHFVVIFQQKSNKILTSPHHISPPGTSWLCERFTMAAEA